VRLAQREPARSPISLVAMIDVLMILLVFFMVTSTYLDLDMIPMAERGDAAPEAADPGGGGARLLVRLGADGLAHLGGQAMAPGEVGPAIAARRAEAPGLEVILLPSGGASVQALVSVMDAAVTAGAGRVRIVRLEADR
jgi:biopolymer transport protein ExbD